MAIDLPAPSVTCHHTGHQKPCRDLAAGCPLYQQIEGTDQNGKKVSGWGCADAYQLSGLAGVIKKLDQVDAEISALRADIRKRARPDQSPPAPALPSHTPAPRSLIEHAGEKGGWG